MVRALLRALAPGSHDGFASSAATSAGGIVTDIVLRDIEPVLADRLRRIGEARGWDMPQTLSHVLETGLDACEGEDAIQLADHEASALEAAIAAMERVPSDPGFALIGRAQPLPQPAESPDQTIAAHFNLE
jgi:hypothetical protein